MAPVDGGPQRPLPRRRGPVAGTQQREAVAQPGGDLLGGQHAHPGGGQLDGQRHAVQGAADAGHRHRVPLGDREAGPGRRRPVREQLDRLEAGQLHRVPGSVQGRHGERRDLPHGFLRDPQRFLAGGHDAQLRAAGQQTLAERGARVNQMLAAVEHDQRLPGLQGAGQRVRQRVTGLGLNADDGGHPGDDQVWLPQVAQFDRVDPVSEVPGHGGQQPQRQPGLADPARAAQGQRPGAVQRVTQAAELAFPPDEPVWLLRQGRRSARDSSASDSIFPLNRMTRSPSVLHYSARPAPGTGWPVTNCIDRTSGPFDLRLRTGRPGQPEAAISG